MIPPSVFVVCVLIVVTVFGFLLWLADCAGAETPEDLFLVDLVKMFLTFCAVLVLVFLSLKLIGAAHLFW